jgi:hypothetical protein
VGKAGAKESTQRWVTRHGVLDAHGEDVAALVGAGSHLFCRLSKRGSRMNACVVNVRLPSSEITPDIPVRTNIEVIEAEARAKGWPAEATEDPAARSGAGRRGG